MFYYIILVAIAIYLVLKYVYAHWERSGFPYNEAVIPFGSLLPVVLKKRSFGTAIFDVYNSAYEPFIGIYLLFRPALLVRDAELVRNILVKDFNSFHDRGIYCNEANDPTSASLFALPGQKWKFMRTKLTPTFTSGKLKQMMPALLEVGEDLVTYVRAKAMAKEQTIEIDDTMTRYVLNALASVFFGQQVNTFVEQNAEFRQIAKLMTPESFLEGLRSTASFLCPKVLEVTGIKGLSKELRNKLTKIVETTFDYREKNGVVRKDFMHMLMQLRNTGTVGEDGDWETGSGSTAEKTLTIDQCVAQVFVFFAAGFVTSSSTASFCLYELAKNPELMKRMVEEIDEEMKKTNGEVTYDSIHGMEFLDLCISETIRMYPALPILNRECTQDYPIPGSHLTIKKGTSIIISLYGIHRDKKYFPDPDTFMPDRFVTKDFDEMAYIPFGDGPRKCIALRQGKMFAKVALVQLLKNFQFTLADNRPMEFTATNVTLIPLNGINLKVSIRE